MLYFFFALSFLIHYAEADFIILFWNFVLDYELFGNFCDIKVTFGKCSNINVTFGNFSKFVVSNIKVGICRVFKFIVRSKVFFILRYFLTFTIF